MPRIPSTAAPHAPGRSKSSRRWLDRHFSDEYVKRAQQAGYRSRAVFKLLEIQEKDRLLAPGMRVADLGAAPGGWSQIAARLVGDKGHLVALDLLPMDPLPGVTFIQGDFRDEDVLAQLAAQLQGQSADLVLSDMAPNLSGIESVDAAHIEHLVELALAFAQAHLSVQGALVTKVFHGSSYDSLFKRLRETFVTVKRIKPKASRDRSSETFLVGLVLK